MPYFPQKQVQNLNSGTFVFQAYSPDIGLFGPINEIRSEVYNYDWIESRTGTNSSREDLFRVFGANQWNLVITKRTIGYRTQLEKRKKWYRDKNNRFRFRWETRRNRIPIEVRFARFEMKPGKRQPRQDEFLKPNHLFYRVGYSFANPKNIRIAYDVPTPASSSWRGFVDCIGPGSYTSYPTYYGPTIQYGIPLTNPPTSISPDPELNNEALRKLYNKVHSDLPDYFTAAAESPELISLLKRTAKEGLLLAKEIYRLDVKRLAGRLNSKVSANDLAGVWLSWIYGITPTLNDIDDTLRVLSREERTWRSFSTSVMHRATTDDSSNLSVFIQGTRNSNDTTISRWGVIMEGRMNIARYLMRASHWQVTASTIYQVVPLTFMVDWIADISGYLSACTVLDTLELTSWNTYSAKTEHLISGKFAPNPLYPTFARYWSPEFSAGYLTYAVRRDVYGSLPDMPDIKVAKPVWDTTSFQRALNAFAILVARR